MFIKIMLALIGIAVAIIAYLQFVGYQERTAAAEAREKRCTYERSWGRFPPDCPQRPPY